jgi:AcrR family transcriptional regulator
MSRPANPELPQRILETGERIIIEGGPEALNMRKLAAGVGVTATTLYHYFDSKEALLLKLKIVAAERLNHRIREIENDPDPGQVLKNLGLVYIRFAEEYPRLYRFLFETPLAGLPLSAEDTPVLYYTYFVARGAIERMHQARSIPIEPRVDAMMGWTMLHGFCSLLLSGTLQPAEGLNAEQLKEIFMQVYAHGSHHNTDASTHQEK